MLKKGKKRRIGITIDMTPMVDIAFLLLIFYMATTQFKPPEEKSVALPSSHSQRDLPPKNFITITVTGEDSVFVDFIIKVPQWNDAVQDSIIVPIRDVTQSSPELVGSVVQQMRGQAASKGVRNMFLIMKADRLASFGVIQTIMKKLQDEKLNSFQVITELDQAPL